MVSTLVDLGWKLRFEGKDAPTKRVNTEMRINYTRGGNLSCRLAISMQANGNGVLAGEMGDAESFK